MKNKYSPDILNCLANLSSDEVFTSPELANRMLDLLPQELFRSSKTRFLDPCSKSGVFLREIAKRLLAGLEEQIPNLQQRIDHIMTKQVFGIACTDLTAEMSRRTLYCTKQANGEYSVATCFDDAQGNLRYIRCQHTWENGKCKHCGANRSQYDRLETIETYAYPFIHKPIQEILNKDMQFDVIIGNPPYQLNVGVEKENYAIAIYHKFVQQAKKLEPRYLCMIIPARWHAGGRGIDEFRDEMLHDNHLRVLADYPDASDVFPGVQIKAGVCYFLWDKDNAGDCSVTTNLNGEKIGPTVRPLLEKGATTFIRYNQMTSIYYKMKAKNNQENSFSSLVSPQTPFGIITSEKGHLEKTSSSDVKMYISGNEKEYKGGTSFIEGYKITKGKNLIDCHKVLIGKAGSGSDSFPHSILSTPFYAEPGTVCNQTYLVIGPFKDKNECNNVISYIKTRFFRFMVLLRKNSQDAMRGVYQFVPMQDFSHPWTDEMLYKKYDLDKDEIAFIESMIRPME